MPSPISPVTMPAGCVRIGHARIFAEFLDIGDGEAGAHAVHAADEIVDHAVGFGMAGIEAIQFAVGDHVDAGQFLRFEHHHDGVAQACRGWSRRSASAARDNCPQRWFECAWLKPAVYRRFRFSSPAPKVLSPPADIVSEDKHATLHPSRGLFIARRHPDPLRSGISQYRYGRRPRQLSDRPCPGFRRRHVV